MRPKSSKSEKKTIQPTKRGIVFAKTLSMKKKILVADDDPGIRDIFKIIFEKAGYEVEIKDNPIDIYKNNFFLPDLFCPRLLRLILTNKKVLGKFMVSFFGQKQPNMHF